MNGRGGSRDTNGRPIETGPLPASVLMARFQDPRPECRLREEPVPQGRQELKRRHPETVHQNPVRQELQQDIPGNQGVHPQKAAIQGAVPINPVAGNRSPPVEPGAAEHRVLPVPAAGISLPILRLRSHLLRRRTVRLPRPAEVVAEVAAEAAAEAVARVEAAAVARIEAADQLGETGNSTVTPWFTFKNGRWS